ncbi:MAG: hypothetical protein JO078_02715 [Candidatus Eremiobacteraeota bacterium]|nr:hypothetical protein [Candidatus Eremiobacteraeota bacterium]MBV9056769.1 hypothetical protein [Candidatus Eremiobacteraeota bacterium]MBV9699017.1 hypothetical protein [Candidatus Eremiobacteraeota bacterium]
MRALIAGLAVLFVAAPMAVARAQETTPAALTGKMQPFSYLLGNPWNCTTNVPAMGNMPAHTDQGSGTFQVAPGNVVHGHVATPMFMGDFYYGYDARSNMYWQTSADNLAGHAFMTSSDGRTYTGTTAMGPMSAQDTVTYARTGDNKITVHDVMSAAGQQSVTDSVCTR